MIENHKHCGWCGCVLPADYEFTYMGDINTRFCPGHEPYCPECWNKIKDMFPGYD